MLSRQMPLSLQTMIPGFCSDVKLNKGEANPLGFASL